MNKYYEIIKSFIGIEEKYYDKIMELSIDYSELTDRDLHPCIEEICKSFLKDENNKMLECLGIDLKAIRK